MSYNIKDKNFTLRPSLPDRRDYPYVPISKQVRSMVDLREWASPVDNQSNLGSCSANALVNAYELLTIKNSKEKYIDLSRLFLYYNIRVTEGTVREDAGAYLTNAIKSFAGIGVCSELLWPYEVTKFNIQPTPECYEDAKTRLITNYRKLNNLESILDALNNNIPVVFGTTIHSSFNNVSVDNPILTIPNSSDSIIGGHAMCLVGYDYPKRLLLAKNSYGIQWGDQGYCWIPFEYAKSEFFDIWVFDII